MTTRSQFALRRPTSLESALAELVAPGAVPLGGGTDLLVRIDEGLAQPSSVVALGAIPAFAAIDDLDDGALRIGAAASIQAVADDPRVRAHFPALAQACDSVGTPALRTMGTLGGNLCQRPRCWYYRRNIPCLKNGGASCPARDGENQYLAILDGDPCYIVHPSDPAVALVALGARVEIGSSRGGRSVPMDAFYVLPRDRLDAETVLADDEVITAVEIPSSSRGGRQLYRKVMQRGAWDFALASIAAVKNPGGDVRMAMGGVAPRPWVVSQAVAEDVSSGGLDEDSIGALAARAMYDARPLGKNAYKVALAESLIRDAIRALDQP